MIQMSPKESALLKDLKDAEQLCIDKYTRHSSQASDPQLKNLFSQFAQNEQSHWNTLSQMEKGETPSAASGSQSMPSFTKFNGSAQDWDKDCFLCTDLLSGEKYASHLYDTCIFEFADENQRNTLAQIQKQEQNHGKMLYDYMQVNSMY